MATGDRCCVLSSLKWLYRLACMIQQCKESKSMFVDKKCLSRLFIFHLKMCFLYARRDPVNMRACKGLGLLVFNTKLQIQCNF